MTDHHPTRPLWQCCSCRTDWPCQSVTGLVAALSAIDREQFAGRMTRLMSVAADELGPVSPARLYRRFVGWVLEEGHRCRVCEKRGHDVLPGLPPRLFPCDGRPVEPVHPSRGDSPAGQH